MMAGHTPGPWTSEQCPCGYSPCRTIMSPCEKVAEGVSIDNAALISAAPDLLEVAQMAKAHLIRELEEPGRTVFWKLVAAIAKATGGEK